MTKIETTTKKFKAGILLTGEKSEIRWESTGHLAVRLTDELGEVSLAKRTIKVDVPKEGLVELTTDDDGRAVHPDVPFQDYDLDLGDDVHVHVPAVANPTDLHERHVPGVRFAFANVVVCDAMGEMVSNTEVTFEAPDGSTFSLITDGFGTISDREPRPPGEYKLSCAAGTVTTELASRRAGIAIVTLAAEDPA